MPNLPRLATGVTLNLLRRLAPMLAPGDRTSLARELMQDRFHPASRALAALFGAAIDAWKNRQYDVERSGEAALLGRLRPFRPTHLLDVGANIGEWMLAACRELPGTRVHAFEIVPATFAQLVAAVGPFSGHVSCHPFGLGCREGEVTMHFAPDSPTTASMLRSVIDLASSDQGFAGITEVQGHVRRGDDVLEEQGIASVDLLKIDVEGAEMDVLAGFETAFAARRINLVQFEYGRANLTTRIFLADFYAYFTARGFVLGKLYPEGVAFKPYDVDDEDFTGPNYVACLTTRPDLIKGLGCPPP